MDGHSRGRRPVPKGLLFQEGDPKHTGKKFLAANTVFIPGRVPDQKPWPRRYGDFVIGRGYSEPVGNDLMEEMLQQRDYIID